MFIIRGVTVKRSSIRVLSFWLYARNENLATFKPRRRGESKIILIFVPAPHKLLTKSKHPEIFIAISIIHRNLPPYVYRVFIINALVAAKQSLISVCVCMYCCDRNTGVAEVAWLLATSKQYWIICPVRVFFCCQIDIYYKYGRLLWIY